MKRLRVPDYVVGLAGVAMIASLFVLDGAIVTTVVLVLAAAMALAVPVLTAVSDEPTQAIKIDVLAAWATLVATLVALVTLFGDGDALFALLASLVAFAACWRAMRDGASPGLRPPPAVRAMPTPPEHEVEPS